MKVTYEKDARPPAIKPEGGITMKVTSNKDIGGTDILGFKSIPDGSCKAPGGGSGDSEVVGM